MEIIKKRICLENFKSRMPALIETVDIEGVEKTPSDGSWGEIPNPIIILGQELRYGTLMDYYNIILDVVKSASYYEYDMSGGKWLEIDYDWRKAFSEQNNITYVESFPSSDLRDRMIVGMVTSFQESLFYEFIEESFGYGNGFSLLNDIHSKIGLFIIPYVYDGIYVPYSMYLAEIPDHIEFMEELKTEASKSCCNLERYNEYGGDDFLNYLKSKRDAGWETYVNPHGTIATVDIPVLLTTQGIDMGQFKSYNVDELDEDSQSVVSNNNAPVINPSIVKTTGESKLRNLRRRKVSVDDDGRELPGIFNRTTRKIETPYKVGYIKNIITKDGIYGDVISEMTETITPIVTKEGIYDTVKKNAILAKAGSDVEGFKEGDFSTPIEGLNDDDTYQQSLQYGDTGCTFEDVVFYYNTNSLQRTILLKDKMLKLLKQEYPDYYCYQQKYKFVYNLTFGEEDGSYEDAEGNIITRYKASAITQTCEGTIYVTFDNPQMEITYVLGGRLRENGDKLVLDETSPFRLQEWQYSSWDGEGIWYKETYPLLKMCIEERTIDGAKTQLVYDKIDFDSKVITYDYPGIDFPRKNYILCNNKWYKSDSSSKLFTSDPVFRDEKMVGLHLPLKEKYDVTIDRGTASAFERHLQLSEIKTFADLENYRNGLFFNK